MSERADVIVLGMGPGGEDVAGRLAEAGLDVVGIERALVGGECPYWGCVPSKMIIRAANLLAEGRRIPGMAGASTVEPDWAPVAQRIRDQATDNWNDKVAVDRFVSKGGRFVRGTGRLTGAAEVSVEGVAYLASRGVVIATGTSPSIPPIPGLAGLGFWTNHDLMQITQLPASMVVLGGGAVGLEMAQALSRFGVRVTVVEAAERILPLEEPEVGDELAGVLTAEGIDVRAGRKATSVGMDGDQFAVTLEGGERVLGERLLVATGRVSDLAALGVGAVGIDPTNPRITVDARMRAAEAVWAVGDVTGIGAFTHIAMYQAAIAAADILGQETAGSDYRALPRVTFTDPEVASAGLTESRARSQGINVRTGSARVAHSARGWIHGPGNEGFIKLVEDAERGILVGATSMGPWGGEVLSMLCLAIHAEVPTDHLRGMIYAYPTFHRGIQDALRALAG